MKKFIENASIVISLVLYFMPFIYIVSQIAALCLGIPKDELAHFLAVDGFTLFCYDFVALLLWKMISKVNHDSCRLILGMILGIVMVVTFVSPSIFKLVTEFSITTFGLALFVGFIIMSILAVIGEATGGASQPTKTAKEYEQEQKDYFEEQRREMNEMFKRPNWKIEYAIDRGNYVEILKYDENNPSPNNRKKDGCRGKLISYSSNTVTVLDGNQTFIYYADGHRISRPAPGH